MATEKPRFSITVSDDVYQQINDYQHEHRLPTQTKAVLAFIEKGLEVIQSEKKALTGIIEVEQITPKPKKSPNATEATEGEKSSEDDTLRSTLLHNFDQLNREGQERLVETSDDMVRSGKYIKSDTHKLGKAKNA